jgi:hypothetical protein
MRRRNHKFLLVAAATFDLRQRYASMHRPSGELPTPSGSVPFLGAAHFEVVKYSQRCGGGTEGLQW